MIALAAGVLLGLAGSAHCGAMCGPLALLVDGPRQGDDGGGRWRRRIAYHAARLTTYAALGAAAGIGGHTLTQVGLGRGLALAAGLTLIGLACLDLRSRRRGREAPGRIARALGRAGSGLRRRALAHPAALGVLNGLLPCGLIYAAITAALGTGSLAGGLAMMIGFGLGTVPALLGVAVFASAGAAGSIRFRRVVAPLATAVGGLVLIVQAVAPGLHDHHVAGVAPATATAATAPLAAGHRHP
jgi:sulfite exporter TauE/SafE